MDCQTSDETRQGDVMDLLHLRLKGSDSQSDAWTLCPLYSVFSRTLRLSDCVVYQYLVTAKIAWGRKADTLHRECSSSELYTLGRPSIGCRARLHWAG